MTQYDVILKGPKKSMKMTEDDQGDTEKMRSCEFYRVIYAIGGCKLSQKNEQNMLLCLFTIYILFQISDS